LKHTYSATPSLTPIISLLQRPNSIFDVQSPSATIDYEDLGHHVNVLSVALSDIDAFVVEEQAVTKKNRVSKTSDKPQTDLQVVVKMLNLINGRIGIL
jgi:hypothetical protein